MAKSLFIGVKIFARNDYTAALEFKTKGNMEVSKMRYKYV